MSAGEIYGNIHIVTRERYKSEKKELRSGLTGKGVSIRNMQVCIAVLTLVLSVLLLIATYRATAGYQFMQEETKDFIKLHDSSSELREASDYLTEQVRCYAETGDLQYLNNYFTEANETKRREKALDTLKGISGESEAYRSLSSAMDESVKLMDREYYSMKLTSIAYGYDLTTLPEEIQNVELTEEDQALSAEEKDALARKMVFDEVYHGEKEAIYSHMQDCISELEKTVQDQEIKTADEFSHLFKEQRLLIITAIIITLSAMLFTLMLLVSPLLRAVVFIHADEPIPVEGSREFRFLADTYNTMYKSNKEQQQQLEYEATHDHLTGLYNRSGFDYFMNSIDLNDSALIIIDVDKFKGVNDNLGHESGDKILVKVTNAIKDSFRSQDRICRLGGDEFAVILQHVDSVSISAVAEKIDVINKKLSDRSDGLPAVHVSAGISLGLNRDADEVFRRADSSMYKVKAEGGSGYNIAQESED